jgi:hypothetical protein
MLTYPLLNYKNQTGDDSMNGPGIDGWLLSPVFTIVPTHRAEEHFNVD